MINRRAWPGLLIVVVAAVVAAGSFAAWWSGRTTTGTTVTLDGLQARAHDARWMNLEHHEMDNGYAMPAQMMPGAPDEGETRLGVPVTLANTGSEWNSFNLGQEFFLIGTGITAPLAVQADTFGRLTRLGPGSAVDGVLYFDTGTPSADAHYILLWRHDGNEERLALRIVSGALTTPSHHH